MGKRESKELIAKRDLGSTDLELKKKFEKINQSKASIEDFFNEFLGQFLSEQTKKAYQKDLSLFFNFLASGGERIDHPNKIKAGHFQVYRDELVKKAYSSATINRRLVAIRSFMKWSVATALIGHNPLDAIKLPKVQTDSPTLAFDDHEVSEMLSCPDTKTKVGLMHKMAMQLLFSLGLRRSELAKIKIKDFFKDRGHYVLKIDGKGGKLRLLPISSVLAMALKEYMDGLVEHSIQLEADDYLLQSMTKGKNNRPINGSTIYRIIEKYRKSCGINKKVGPHSCRATAISHLLDTQKTPIRDVAIFAGHSNITTTERYDKRRGS